MSLPNQVKQKLIQIGDIDEDRMNDIEEVIDKFYIRKKKLSDVIKKYEKDDNTEVCSECSFEARNGHSFKCSKYKEKKFIIKKK